MLTKVYFTLPEVYVSGATEGYLLGEFNAWNPQDAVVLQKIEDGSMKAELKLEAGKSYQYRYLLNDGRWVNDGNATILSDVHGNTKVSLIVLALSQRYRFNADPALSLVPLALAPPKGCCPTTAPVGLSLI